LKHLSISSWVHPRYFVGVRVIHLFILFVFVLCLVSSVACVCDCSIIALSCFSNICYCTVHVYVVIHICDSMRSLWVKVNLLRFFIIVDFISVLPLEIHLLRENGCGAIFRLNPATFLWLSYVRTRISNPIYLGYLCVQWFDVRCGCPYFIIFFCVLL
jgi:hypothetical protein